MEDSENKENKNLVPIKLPEELRRELRREINARFERGEPEPTYGDLLLEAWKAYKHIANYGEVSPTSSDDPPLVKSNHAESSGTATSGIGQIPVLQDPNVELSKEEIGWVHRLLRLLRSGSSTVQKALHSNFVVFEEALEYERGTPNATTPPAPVGGGVQDLSAALDQADRDRRRSAKAIAELQSDAQEDRENAGRKHKKIRGGR